LSFPILNEYIFITAYDVWSIQFNFVSNWLEWIIISLGLITICKFMANCALMYGIFNRKPSFVKCWLIVGFVEIFLIFLASLLELFLFIYTLTNDRVDDGWPMRRMFGGIVLGLIMIGFFLFIFIKIGLWRLVYTVHEDLKKERKEKKAWDNYIDDATTCNHDDTQIEKGNGKYMRF